MELSDRPYGFTRLLDSRVVDRSGRRLGHAFEVMARQEPNGALRVEAILVGRAALLRRLKGPAAAALEIPWEAVVEVTDDCIVVQR